MLFPFIFEGICGRFLKAEGGELQRAWSLLAAGDELVLEEGEHVLTSPLVLGGIQVRLSCQQAEKEGRAGSKQVAVLVWHGTSSLLTIRDGGNLAATGLSFVHRGDKPALKSKRNDKFCCVLVGPGSSGAFFDCSLVSLVECEASEPYPTSFRCPLLASF